MDDAKYHPATGDRIFPTVGEALAYASDRDYIVFDRDDGEYWRVIPPSRVN